MNTESTLQRLFRKRFTLKRRRPHKDGTPRDFGVGVTGVVVTIVILGILAAIGGPPLWRLITDAREHKLNSNLQSAAQVVRDRLTLEPEWMTETGSMAGVTATTGAPTTALLTALVEDLPFTWENGWPLDLNAGNDETIRVQFLDDGAAVIPTSATAPPTVDWLQSDWKAVRVQASNSDGAWACALIVVRPNVTDTDVYTGSAVVSTNFVTPPTLVSAAQGKSTVDAWLGGIWYDSGDSYADAAASWQHCSPVGESAAATSVDHEWLPESAQTWSIHTAANTTAKAAGRTLTRNL